jgi:DNA uptake protein ComE-like DNA-binding protein
MSKTPIHLAVLGAAVLAVAGCTHRAERRAHDTYHDVFGSAEREGRQVDLNTASRRELARLPGLTDDDADRIIANRPYGSPRALLRRRVIGERKYDEIQDYVYASQTGRRTGEED